ncbi:UDP-2,3-diacylglucosamine diphosphatase LpxI [Octadecabacter sp. 1_MG-2023]|uniref:LpxI family protein n=1 Tax=unclassified Octadecabacter TaxID=196158 RepID=UPI001C08871D|nr:MULTISPECIES: UDP-2,3-diacylglucosamine diphosphatase LpxI [unclassified Octadecabacter]MBU2993214.1 UDP-2,3-diacylglucosamine diphosphatase LpxI [Octadecabacter sp. B2R22]MDO6733332.1 UDP-2,3-diacylglucosamine diphosphatase LpxI [Octadecabacter sp. 1_MG-2023]
MTIALIAGTGGLPPHLAGSLMVQGRTPIICEMRGFVSEIVGDFPRVGFRIETLGTFLKALKDLGVTEVCMAGAMQRPDVDPAAIDPATAPLVPRLMAAMAKGDDGTLREIISIFEEHGFSILGAHDVAPDLLPIRGQHTTASVPDLTADLTAADVALKEMGQADQGQAMLLRDGAVIAREDARGTEAMLRDFCEPLEQYGGSGDPLADLVEGAVDLVSDAIDWITDKPEDIAPNAKGAILFKAPKPDQILKADMPLIGPDTAMQAAEAGLAGIVIPQGRVMVLDLPQVVAILNAQGMFLQVVA